MDLIVAIVSYMTKEPEEKVRIHFYRKHGSSSKSYLKRTVLPACSHRPLSFSVENDTLPPQAVTPNSSKRQLANEVTGLM